MKTRVANQVGINLSSRNVFACKSRDVGNMKHNTISLNTIGKFENTDTLARAKSDIQIHPSATKFNCFVL